MLQATYHIIAKSLGIPTLVGVKGILSKVDDGEYICMDAGEGIIVVKPDEDTEKEYLDKKAAYEQERARLEGLRSTPAVTKDGKRIYLCANVGNVQDIRNALPMNIDGVGLFRSEFLYMQNTHFPTEEGAVCGIQRGSRACVSGTDQSVHWISVETKNCLTMNLKKRRIHSLDGEQSVFLWT